jgi:hypothetical protein
MMKILEEVEEDVDLKIIGVLLSDEMMLLLQTLKTSQQ